MRDKRSHLWTFLVDNFYLALLKYWIVVINKEKLSTKLWVAVIVDGCGLICLVYPGYLGYIWVTGY